MVLWVVNACFASLPAGCQPTVFSLRRCAGCTVCKVFVCCPAVPAGDLKPPVDGGRCGDKRVGKLSQAKSATNRIGVRGAFTSTPAVQASVYRHYFFLAAFFAGFLAVVFFVAFFADFLAQHAMTVSPPSRFRIVSVPKRFRAGPDARTGMGAG